MAGGLAPDTPVAAVTWGTRPEQRTVRATLADDRRRPASSRRRRSSSARSPAIDLAWFERRPLFGRRVVVTRARAQASRAGRARSAALGAEAIERAGHRRSTTRPTAAPRCATPPADAGGLRLGRASRRPTASHRFFAHVPDTRALGGAQVAAIGPGHGRRARRVPGGRRPGARPLRGRGAARRLPRPGPGPGAAGRGPRSPATSCPTGCGPRAGTSTSSRLPHRAARRRRRDRRRGRGADAITFTSSSTVEHYLDAAGADRVPPVVACIGPVTAATAREHGLAVDVEAEVHTIDGLVDALVAHLT